MLSSLEWKSQFESEIARAEEARAAGKEGMARVCARRAAGIIIGEYFARRGAPPGTPSAYDRLRQFSALPETSPQAAATANRLVLRVTPEYTLPVEADLIADALWLRLELLGE